MKKNNRLPPNDLNKFYEFTSLSIIDWLEYIAKEEQ